MRLLLYNTATRKKEEIVPLEDNLIKVYTCGPTVYDFAHIGNFRTYIFEDLLRRTLEFLGYRVYQIMNITDIDDKTIKGAMEKKISLKEHTSYFEKAFFEDMEVLKIQKAHQFPRATEYVAEMIKIIEDLLEKKIAYLSSDGSVYFSLKHFPNYGQLSHLKLDELEEGASERIATDEYDKENVADFVLWKKHDPKRDGNNFWESPFGRGRPGWHIECSAMAIKLLGNTVDLHCGGVDNIFPHHENEIAQSESYTKERFVRYWAHADHLIVDGRKMSKSLNNFYTLRDLLGKGYTGNEIRYLLLHIHYRVPLNFTFEGLEASRITLQRLADFVLRMSEIEGEKEGDIAFILDAVADRFSKALADDLNISAALSALFDLVREVNYLCDAEKIGRRQADKILGLLKKMDEVLDIIPFEVAQKLTIPEEITKALEEREKARKEKKWQQADNLRRFILEKGYIIEDTKLGVRVKKKS